METRKIVNRRLQSGVEVFLLDSLDVVAEAVGVIPEGVALVSFMRLCSGVKCPGLCTNGSIRPAVAQPSEELSPYSIGPPCACYPAAPDVPLMPQATEEWLSNLPSNPRLLGYSEWEVLCLQPESVFCVYRWCPSIKKAVFFGMDSKSMDPPLDPPAVRKIIRQLEVHAGYYAVVMAGAECVSIWSCVSGCWMGPPYDRRIAGIFGLDFAQKLLSASDGDSQPTLDALKGIPGKVVVRSTFEASRIL